MGRRGFGYWRGHQDPASKRENARKLWHRRSSASCGRCADVIIVARPFGAAAMPTPLHFTDEEMSLLINLSGPIAPAARPAFLDAVAAAIEAKGQLSGAGIVHQVGRQIQRQFWEPPALPNQSAPVHRGTRVA
jgi:hypothetical protein